MGITGPIMGLFPITLWHGMHPYVYTVRHVGNQTFNIGEMLSLGMFASLLTTDCTSAIFSGSVSSFSGALAGTDRRGLDSTRCFFAPSRASGGSRDEVAASPWDTATVLSVPVLVGVEDESPDSVKGEEP